MSHREKTREAPLSVANYLRPHWVTHKFLAWFAAVAVRVPVREAGRPNAAVTARCRHPGLHDQPPDHSLPRLPQGK